MMKYKKYIYYLIVAITTAALLWGVPQLVKKATYTPDNYPFIQYSSMLKELVFIDYKDKKTPLRDMEGNSYTTAQFDSLMPMLNFRQLMVDNRLPDSIDGHEITPQILRTKSLTFRYNPSQEDAPQPKLHILFEAMPKRVGLEVPDDVFRIEESIEFIDAATNQVDKPKSALFQQALEKRKFQFPAQWASGNPNQRKPYDEGYFCLDAAGNLFHLKMVNNRPYVSNTGVSDSIDIASFSMLEVADKRFYGFLFSQQGEVYILEGEEGGYHPRRLDIDPLDLKQDQMSIMGNLLYWTVTVTTPTGRTVYGLNTSDLRQIARYDMQRPTGKWDTVSRWLFPWYLTLEDSNSGYIYPRIQFTGFTGFVVNILLAIFVVSLVKDTKRRKGTCGVFVLLTGVAGLIALFVLPDIKFKK